MRLGLIPKDNHYDLDKPKWNLTKAEQTYTREQPKDPSFVKYIENNRIVGILLPRLESLSVEVTLTSLVILLTSCYAI